MKKLGKILLKVLFWFVIVTYPILLLIVVGIFYLIFPGHEVVPM